MFLERDHKRFGAAGTAGDPRKLGLDNDEGNRGEMRDVCATRKFRCY